MFYSEHGVPHFHAVYGEYEASVEIESERVHGHLPRRALALYLNGITFTGKNCSRTGNEPAPVGLLGGSLLWSEHMDYHVLEARHVSGHTLWLRFRDGSTAEVDVAPVLRGPIFEPLKDVAYFKRFEIHPEFHTLVWPNGADTAPEYLHECGLTIRSS